MEECLLTEKSMGLRMAGPMAAQEVVGGANGMFPRWIKRTCAVLEVFQIIQIIIYFLPMLLLAELVGMLFGSRAVRFLWRIEEICARLLQSLTVCDLLMLLACLVVSLICHNMVSLICHNIAAVIYLWPTNFISKIPHLISALINKVLAVLREINRTLAEINRTLTESNRIIAEINRGVAVLREIASGRRLLKFVIALFLMYVCILYFGSQPHVPQVAVQPQASIKKDLIVNITVVSDIGGFLVRRGLFFRVIITQD